MEEKHYLLGTCCVPGTVLGALKVLVFVQYNNLKIKERKKKALFRDAPAVIMLILGSELSSLGVN